jgi:ferredoxin
MIDGVATLLRDDYCDGLGDCLPTCPTGAIRFVEREALEYDEAAVKENMKKKSSQLGQWPCQIKLMPITAPYYKGANLLIAADCSAYAYANMHNKFMKGKITVIGCPKLDNVAYAEKLTSIIKNNDIQSVTIVRMEVPCCGGLEMAAKKALQDSGKFIPWQVFTITTDGRIKE